MTEPLMPLARRLEAMADAEDAIAANSRALSDLHAADARRASARAETLREAAGGSARKADPSSPIDRAHSAIDGTAVARMIIDFHAEFKNTYPDHVLSSNLCAVGPLQSMIGLAILNGRLLAKEPRP